MILTHPEPKRGYPKGNPHEGRKSACPKGTGAALQPFPGDRWACCGNCRLRRPRHGDELHRRCRHDRDHGDRFVRGPHGAVLAARGGHPQFAWVRLLHVDRAHRLHAGGGWQLPRVDIRPPGRCIGATGWFIARWAPAAVLGPERGHHGLWHDDVNNAADDHHDHSAGHDHHVAADDHHDHDNATDDDVNNAADDHHDHSAGHDDNDAHHVNDAAHGDFDLYVVYDSGRDEDDQDVVSRSGRGARQQPQHPEFHLDLRLACSGRGYGWSARCNQDQQQLPAAPGRSHRRRPPAGSDRPEEAPACQGDTLSTAVTAGSTGR